MMSDCEMIPFATGNALCRILHELFFSANVIKQLLI